MRRLGLLFFAVMVTSVLSACGAGEAPVSTTSPMGLAPKMIKLAQMGDGVLSATAEVFDSTEKSLGEKNLAIDIEQGRAYSPDGQGFKLEKGRSYSGLVIFYYQLGAAPLPIGFVVKNQEVTEDFTNFNWAAEEIILSNSQIQGSAELNASFVPQNKIPDLDLNQNGFSNLQDFIEGIDPTDPQGLPQGPEVVGGVDPEGHVDAIEIELDFTDPSGVALIEAAGPTCGYSHWEVTSVNETTKHLKASFNLHSLPLLLGPGELKLKIKATDSLGASKVYEYQFAYEKTDIDDPEKLGPEIAIFTPTQGAVLSGEVEGLAEACDESGIKTLKVVNVGADLGDQEDSEALYEGLIDSQALGDGENRLLEFRAVAADGKVKTRSVLVTVANDSPIKIDHPTPGSDVKDQFELVAYVNLDQMPKASFLSVESVRSSLVAGVPFEEQEEDPIFAKLKKTSNTTTYAESLDLASITNELYFTVAFRAVGFDGKEFTRRVPFHVNNDPDISIGARNGSGDFHPVLSPGLAFIDWEVTNRGENDPVWLNGKPQTDANNQWLDSGSVPLVLQGNDQDNLVPKEYTVKANRKVNNNLTYVAEKKINVTLIKLKGFEDGLIDPFTEVITLEGAPPTTSWKAIFESKNKTFEMTGTGNKIFLSDLEPRTEYEVIVQILNASGKGVITESFPLKFFTSDFRLVAWYPFYLGASKYFDLADENLTSYLTLGGSVEWIEEDPFHGLFFDTSDDNYAYAYSYDEEVNVHGSAKEISLEILLSIDDASKAVDYLVNKTGEFAFGFDPEKGYKVRLQIDKLCSDPFDDYIASEIPVTEGIHHVVVTYNANKEEVVFYIDGGKEKKVVPVKGSKLQNYCYTWFSLNRWFSYNQEDSIYGNFQGILADLAIYNRALSQEEVVDNCKRAGLCN